MKAANSVLREPALPSDWEMVVGLEVHVELNTKSKLFCGCANRFGDEPNTNVCPVCLGLPGSLPVVNLRAVKLAIRLGRALGCEINPAVFARKNYFYPDMPKNYQISQYQQAINTGGAVKLPDGSVVELERAHIEEDTGKTIHIGGSGRIKGAAYSLVDHNRAGVPLIEIVTLPQLYTASQVRAFVRELRAILLATDVSDARMQEGSMRVDANVSVRPADDSGLRTRCEIKNISSVRSLSQAVVYEANRHIDLWSTGGSPSQETRHWDEERGCTISGRSKEHTEDYRYFPDPDLAPFAFSKDDIAAVDAALPLLPAARREKLIAACGDTITPETAALLVERDQDELVVDAVSVGADAKRVTTRVVNDLALDDWAVVTPERLAEVVVMETSGRISATQAKKVLAEMVEHGTDPEAIVAARGFENVSSGEIESIVKDIIEKHQDEWQLYCQGDATDRKKMSSFLTGQVMRATKGRADGATVGRLLHQHAQN